MPARRWEQRMLRDTNRRLWGAFVIESGDKPIYFGGDSDYGSHFKELGELISGLDYTMLGIGTFYPEWFMQPSHVFTAEAVQAFYDSGAKRLILMLDLSDESAGLPIRLIKEAHAEGKTNGQLILPKIGETLWV